MSFSIRLLTPKDFDAIDELLMAAYGRPESRRAELARYLALQPDGWFVADAAGVPIGMAGSLSYGSFAWIGLMAVAPARQRGGIGQALLRQVLTWIEAQGCPIAVLDAAAAGERLYLQHGFRDDGATIRYDLTAAVDVARSGETVVRAHLSDLPALIAFDAPLFGADRGTVLAVLLRELPDRFLVARDTAGRVSGFLVAQPHRLGPWVASDAAAAERLLAAALTLPFERPPAVLAPDANLCAGRLLARYGFTPSRRTRHMYRGAAPAPQQRDLIYAQTSFAIG